MKCICVHHRGILERGSKKKKRKYVSIGLSNLCIFVVIHWFVDAVYFTDFAAGRISQ